MKLAIALNIGFAVVALWLLLEVLFQNRAKLLWRVAAFTGFIAVATGVVTNELAFVIIGAAVFGIGQTRVTISHRKNYRAGWVIGQKKTRTRKRSVSGSAHLLTRIATWILPEEDRGRYFEEWHGELWDLAACSRHQQVAHALRILLCVWPTRRAVLTRRQRVVSGR
ncbi:hypothetical protein POF50_021385 [Streptomyces sp. SL13]|uniref:Uncharacterized protein n=1 Tax=Streptantibioticus silvisoli TaxID=2705255 RepID=A0AA90H7A7_9ACTN|nr:hypothetical protein [Streptantibioticus silvisoli]MDI5971854.1 hypothetical protein [Streptantibioticus silvisoli]